MFIGFLPRWVKDSFVQLDWNRSFLNWLVFCFYLFHRPKYSYSIGFHRPKCLRWIARAIRGKRAAAAFRSRVRDESKEKGETVTWADPDDRWEELIFSRNKCTLFPCCCCWCCCCCCCRCWWCRWWSQSPRVYTVESERRRLFWPPAQVTSISTTN